MHGTTITFKTAKTLFVLLLISVLPGCLLSKDPVFADEQCGEVECGAVSVDGETYQCGTCEGTAYCSEEGKCIDDCALRECGTSPEGFECGTCANAADFCSVDGRCEVACGEARECGEAPDGRDCGICSGETEYCSSEGQCIDSCADIECGPSINVYSCGECTGTSYCDAGQCVDVCADIECGEHTFELKTYDCGVCDGITELCEDNMCLDQCEGIQCGPAGTVASCGTCTGARDVCLHGQCMDDCNRQECGESSAGFDCGDCSFGYFCNNGNCDDLCNANGTVYECGTAPGHDDVSCGECETWEICNEDQLCESDCGSGWECGPTFSGDAVCGVCDDELECINHGCSDGTWRESDSDVMWSLPNWDNGYYTQAEAVQFCEELELAGYSDWRIPNIAELISLLRGCVSGQETGDFSRSTCPVNENCLDYSCLSIFDTKCDECSFGDGPGPGNHYLPEDFHAQGDTGSYMIWSGSISEANDKDGWLLFFAYGFPVTRNKNTRAGASCVRDVD